MTKQVKKTLKVPSNVLIISSRMKNKPTKKQRQTAIVNSKLINQGFRFLYTNWLKNNPQYNPQHLPTK